MKLSNQDQELYRAIETSIREAERSDVVHQLLMLSLGRVWFKHMKSATQFLDVPGTVQMMAFYAQLGHIADWIDAAVMNDEPWLKNVDAQGRPKKLMKFSTLDQIIREADKAMLKAAQKGRGVRLHGDAESLIAELAEGFYIVELHTPEALDRESAFMQHCIGQGAYDKRLNEANYRYLSLRDPAGKPHVTIELFRSPMQVSNKGEVISLVSEEAAPDGYYWTIMQYQGKQNRAPIAKYTDILVPYLKDCKLGISGSGPANGLDYIVDRNLNWLPVSNLPETLDVQSFNLIGRSDYLDFSRHEAIRLPITLINTSRIVLKQVIVGHFPTYDHDTLRNLLLVSCDIENFSPDAFTNPKLELTLTNCKVGALPEAIDCLEAQLDFRCVEQCPRTIKAQKSVNLSCFEQVSTPIDIKSDLVGIILWADRNSYVEHNIVANELEVHLGNDVNVLPRGIDVQKLKVAGGNYQKDIYIPEDTKVALKIQINNFQQFDHIHFPFSIPDRVLLTDGYTDMHIGEYRHRRRQTAA